MTQLLRMVSGVLLIASIISCQSKDSAPEVQPEAKVETPEDHLKEIMEIWPGTFNNDKQVAALEKEGESIWRIDNSGENGYLHLQSHYIKVNLPEIGDHVLYVEEYRDQVPSETYRQRIYTLSVDSTSTVRVKMWPFKDKKKYVGAWKDPSIIAGLSEEEITAFPDKCDLIVKKVDGKYSMKMNSKDCAFGERYFNYEVLLSKDVFTYRDKISSVETDEMLTSAAAFAYHDLDRIDH